VKVVQVPFCFYPDPVGGTEVYVEALARRLLVGGLEVIVAAPGDTATSYDHHGLQVHRFAVGPVADLRDLYGAGDEQAARQFGTLLDRERPDLVHLHAFTRAASLRLARVAKTRDTRVVFTYHTPTVSCQRGTLLRWGRDVCSGELDTQLCARCSLEGLGLPRALTHIVGRVPAGFGSALGRSGRSGRLWTALRMRELVGLRHAACRALLREVDHVVVLCAWTRDLLVLNGVPPEKMTLSRHGIDEDTATSERRSDRGARDALRVAFFGRLDPVKGAHVLVEAVRRARDLPVMVDVYGVQQGDAGASYLRRLRELADADPRIRFRGPVAPGTVTGRLREYDLLAVPSQWLETGPLVVLEAFSAGVPVLGSRLGGIRELVDDGVNGLLVEPRPAEIWHRALARLCREDGLVARLRAGIRAPRRASAAAEEMSRLYADLCSAAGQPR